MAFRGWISQGDAGLCMVSLGGKRYISSYPERLNIWKYIACFHASVCRHAQLIRCCRFTGVSQDGE